MQGILSTDEGGAEREETYPGVEGKRDETMEVQGHLWKLGV